MAISVLIKPASGLCNLSCRYCFYRDEMANRAVPSCGVMTPETQETVLRRIFETGEREITIAYQGGEPTLAGLPYFERAAALEAQYGGTARVRRAIQTNGVGLDERRARFFADNGYLVGLSLDGTRETHDALRVRPDGEGTHAEVLRAARLFDRCGVEYNILTVVNAKTARRAESIYNFYRRNGFRYLQFIPCLDPLCGEPGAWQLTDEAYAGFLKTLFALWARDVEAGDGVSVRHFDNWLGMLRGLPPESCGMSGVCCNQRVVEADGSVYPCDFYALDEWRLGNLAADSFADIDRAFERVGFREQSLALADECRACRWLRLCGGGCRRERVGGRYRLCQAMKDFFEYAAPTLSRLAARL